MSMTVSSPTRAAPRRASTASGRVDISGLLAMRSMCYLTLACFRATRKGPLDAPLARGHDVARRLGAVAETVTTPREGTVSNARFLRVITFQALGPDSAFDAVLRSSVVPRLLEQ